MQRRVIAPPKVEKTRGWKVRLVSIFQRFCEGASAEPFLNYTKMKDDEDKVYGTGLAGNMGTVFTYHQEDSPSRRHGCFRSKTCHVLGLGSKFLGQSSVEARSPLV